jgi:hypothetical protein
MKKFNRHRATHHQALLIRPTDYFDLIHDLHDALNVGDDLLCQLFLKERAAATLKHKHASFDFAGGASYCRVRICPKEGFSNCGNVT